MISSKHSSSSVLVSINSSTSGTLQHQWTKKIVSGAGIGNEKEEGKREKWKKNYKNKTYRKLMGNTKEEMLHERNKPSREQNPDDDRKPAPFVLGRQRW